MIFMPGISRFSPRPANISGSQPSGSSSINFDKPKRARDLYWRRVNMSVRGGPDGVVYLPAIYGDDDPALSDALRLGQATDWIEVSEGLVRGVGQRMFLVGQDLISDRWT